jgi:hypothetical protein
MSKFIYKSLTKGLMWFLIATFALVALATYTNGVDKVDAGPDYAERMAAKHDCWKGEQPADVEVPGHVIMRYDGDVAVRYLGAKAVGDALEHIFDGKDNGVSDVYAFCR